MTATPLFIAGFERVLLDEAAASARAAASAATPAGQGAKSIACVLLAVAAVEAAVYTWAAQHAARYQFDATAIAEWRRMGVHLVIKQIFGRFRPPVSVASLGWYNGLCCAVELRNHIAHYFPEARRPGTWPDSLKGCVTGKSFVPGGDDTMDWTSRLYVPAVAEQVATVARDAIAGFESHVRNAA